MPGPSDCQGSLLPATHADTVGILASGKASVKDGQPLPINSREDFLAYVDAVADATDGFLPSPDDQALEQKSTVRPVSEMAVRDAIGTICLTQGFTHLGEIQHLRSLLGLRGMPSVRGKREEGGDSLTGASRAS